MLVFPPQILWAIPHNAPATLAASLPPSAACRFLELHPVNLQNLQLHLTKNSRAIVPTGLCGLAYALVGNQKKTPLPCRRGEAFLRGTTLLGALAPCNGSARRSFTGRACGFLRELGSPEPVPIRRAARSRVRALFGRFQGAFSFNGPLHYSRTPRKCK